MPILIKGAGDVASGIAIRLLKSGYNVIMTEIENPTVIRSKVSFAQAVYDNVCVVDGIKAVKADKSNYKEFMKAGIIPVIVNVAHEKINDFEPRAVVDAIMAKRNLGTYKHEYFYAIGLGPGFEAPKDVDVVIETLDGHDLGVCIYDGIAAPNTGEPKELGEHAPRRILRAPITGTIVFRVRVGDHVEEGDEIGFMTDNVELVVIKATLTGTIRGVLRNGLQVIEGRKIGDIDPYCTLEQCFSPSYKGRALGGSVLEALLHAQIMPYTI